ncbi:MAG: hypothetical protein ACT4PM_06660 [Gemmatimonadales bacterium]
MTSRKKPGRSPGPSLLEQARDELFSQILRCGVTEAEPAHQKEWMDDTMQYLAERYAGLSEQELAQVRVLGERFSQPVRPRVEVAGSR